MPTNLPSNPHRSRRGPPRAGRVPSVAQGSNARAFEESRLGLLLHACRLHGYWAARRLEYSYLLGLREYYRAVLRVLRWLRPDRR